MRGVAAGDGGTPGEGDALGDALGAAVCASATDVHVAIRRPAIATGTLLQQPIAMTTH
jgi:hypothetical protein